MWYMVIGGLIGTAMIVGAFVLGVFVTEQKTRFTK
jgi:Kef-type K+ transport system membrane component KefB